MLRVIDQGAKPITATAEYIWLDGNYPQEIRSKTKVIEVYPTSENQLPVPNLSNWGFDGSSTKQASGSDSDCILQPVHYVLDPFQRGANYLVMCEVYNGDGITPHETNTRSYLRTVLDSGGAKAEGLFGFEQEYFFYKHDPTHRGLKKSSALGWPDNGLEPSEQGPYYCAVGSQNVAGRDLANKHLKLCMDSGILICGLNAEVALGQWEFQIGHRGLEGDTEPASALIASDHLIFARYILQRLCEESGVSVCLDPKPIKGDWNGSGLHTNFSTWATREVNQKRNEEGIPVNIAELIARLSETHQEHIEVYGVGNEERLTGDHETCSYKEFRSGGADRGASIRIPIGVVNSGHGYIEDRRPASNADPYLVTAKLLATACGLWLPVHGASLVEN